MTGDLSKQSIMATNSRNHPRPPLFGLVDVNNFYVSCSDLINLLVASRDVFLPC